jgi:hypothetical protein
MKKTTKQGRRKPRLHRRSHYDTTGKIRVRYFFEFLGPCSDCTGMVYRQAGKLATSFQTQGTDTSQPETRLLSNHLYCVILLRPGHEVCLTTKKRAGKENIWLSQQLQERKVTFSRSTTRRRWGRRKEQRGGGPQQHPIRNKRFLLEGERR